MHVRLLREAGGLGDVIRCFPVARGFKEQHPGCEVSFCTLPEYCGFASHCPDIDHVISVGWDERRDRDETPDPAKYPYLRGEFDRTVDLYCPAYRHERDTDGRVTRDRIELFCAAAGVTPDDLLPRYEVRPAELAWVDGWLAGRGVRLGGLIGVAPFASHSMRNWDYDRWRRVLETLEADGHSLLVFDGRRRRLEGLPGVHLNGIELWQLAAFIARGSLFLSVDTGPYHIAAALGTPVVGLFGGTNGCVISKHYRGAMPVQGCGRDCDSPCYMRRSRGWGEHCYETGCRAMQSIRPEQVLEVVYAA